MHLLLELIGIVGMVAGALLIAASNFLYFNIRKEVNDRLPENQRIRGQFTNTRLFQVIDLHRRIYPDSLNRRQWKRQVIGGFVLFFGSFLLLLDFK